MKKPLMMLLLLALLMLSACALKQKQPSGATGESRDGLRPQKIEEKQIDIDGDGKKETVSLVGYIEGELPDGAAPLGSARVVALEVNGEELWSAANEGFCYGRIEQADINRDKLPDIGVRLMSSGSGALQDFYVFLNDKGKLGLVFSPDSYPPQDGFSITPLNGERLLFEDKNSGFKVEMSVPGREDLREHYKTAGAWVDLYSGFEFKDTDYDGMDEIVGRQVVCGVAHADVIGELHTVFAYEGGTYAVREREFHQYQPDKGMVKSPRSK